MKIGLNRGKMYFYPDSSIEKYAIETFLESVESDPTMGKVSDYFEVMYDDFDEIDLEQRR